MSARLELPATPSSQGVTLDGKPAAAQREGGRWIVTEEVTGKRLIEVR
jgi:hypothetical protein